MTALARAALLVAATVLFLTAVLFAGRGEWPVCITLAILAFVAGTFERLLSIGGSDTN